MEQLPRSEPPKIEVPPEGHILSAEAYPRDEEAISLHLMYSESPTEPVNYKARQFQVDKRDAQALAWGILGILNAPDTQTAWENIAKSIHEGDHEKPSEE
jgi:hypothetical protein